MVKRVRGMSFNMNKKIYYMLVILFIVPIVIVGFYNHPSFDDFAYSIDTYHTVLNGGNLVDVLISAFNTSIDFMYSWQGLYTSAFILALQPAIFGEQFYGLTTIILLASVFIGIYALMSSVNKYILKNSGNKNLLLSLLILFFLVETVPTPNQGFYWFNGAMNYMFFWAILLFLVSRMIKYFYTEKRDIFNLLFMIFLAFTMSGGNHVTAFAALFLELVMVIISFVCKKKRLFILPFIFGLVGFGINIMAPGTRVRAEAVPFNGDVIDTLVTTFKKSFGFISSWMTVSLVLFIILFVYIIFNEVKDIKIKYNKKWLLIPFVSYLLLAGMLCVPYYALGGYGAGRINNVIYYTFVITLLVNVTLFLKYLMDKKILNFNKVNFFTSKVMHVVSIFIIIFIGVIGSNLYYYSTSYEATLELVTGQAQRYSKENYDRVNKYTDKNIDKVIVSPFKNKPYLIVGTDVCVITDSEKCDTGSMVEYYDKKVIGIKEKDVEES